MLYLEGAVQHLTLAVPCPFVDGKYDRSKEGWLANLRHTKFSTAIGRDTLADITKAIMKGATVVIGKGFHARNSYISQHCDLVLAYTPVITMIGNGTADTLKKAKGKTIYHMPYPPTK